MTDICHCYIILPFFCVKQNLQTSKEDLYFASVLLDEPVPVVGASISPSVWVGSYSNRMAVPSGSWMG